MRKIILFITILLLTSLVLVGAGCFEKPEPEPEVSFLTYSNTKHGFSLEYPENWHKTGGPDSDMIAFSSKKEEINGGGPPLGTRIELVVLENYENLVLEDWIEEMRSQGDWGDLIKREEITVGGRMAIKEKYAAPTGLVEQGPPILVFLLKDNYIIRFKYLGREPDYSEDLEVFEHLLESFKFSKKSSAQLGSSFETAIIIEADNTDEGIAKEYEWLAANACLNRGGVMEQEMQEFREYKGHKYDLIYMLCNNGEKEIYYFQIDSFFGKW